MPHHSLATGDLDLREYLVAMAVARCPVREPGRKRCPDSHASGGQLEGVLRQCAVELVFGALAPAKLDSVPIASLQEAARVLLPTMSATEVRCAHRNGRQLLRLHRRLRSCAKCWTLRRAGG